VYGFSHTDTGKLRGMVDAAKAAEDTPEKPVCEVFLMTDDDRKVAQPCIWVHFKKKSVCHYRLEPRWFCKDSRKHGQAGIGFKSCYAHQFF
jgi:hypothetical protein